MWGNLEPVRDSPDLRRVLALPRRPAYAAVGRKRATERYRTPEGTMHLRPIQARALADIERAGGGLVLAGVGEGKELVSLLAAVALKAERTVLLVPPALVAQVEHEYVKYAQHWRLPPLNPPEGAPGLYLVSYADLSSPRLNKTTTVLERIRPTLVVANEVHNLRHATAARTKRVARYFRDFHETKFVGLSGTATTRSLRDFAHFLRWALGPGAPVPFAYPDLEAWCGALDSADWPGPAGALRAFCANDDESARDGYRRRLIESPGVVASPPEILPVALYIRTRPITTPPAVLKALDELRGSWVTPGGEEITDALAFSRYARQIAAGFYYRWVWPGGAADDEWLEARREWHREVREFLRGYGRPGLDSPDLVAQAAAAGRIPSYAWSAWDSVRRRPGPDTEAVWIDDYVVRDAVAWGNEAPGVIWYEHAAVGEAVAALGGFPHFGPGDGNRLAAELTREPRAIVLSRKSYGEGWNCQAHCRGLITTQSSNGKTCEQLLGRLHREGQQSDDVWFDVLLNTDELRTALAHARRDADFIEQLLGAPQRLARATYVPNGLDFPS